MKRWIALCSSLMLGLILIILVSCGGNTTLPNVEGNMDVTIFKTALKVATKFIDSEEHDLYNDKVKSYVALSSTGEDAQELYRKEVTISKPAAIDGVIPTILSGAALDFTSLTADTKYVLKLVLSAGGEKKTLATKEIVTLNNGESEDDPILIDSLDMLLGMNKSKDAYYKLTADIDCGGSLSSIFNSSTYFSGTLDGDGHKIYNFKFDSNNYTGLFGYMTGATVKNLVLENVSYDARRSNTYLGALAGYAKRCSISNVTVNNVVFSHSGHTTTSAYVGALIGSAVGCTITDCTAKDVSITIPEGQKQIYVGGFIGENDNSKITNCSVEGKMNVTIKYTGNDNGCLYLGGFSGLNNSTQGIIDCYAMMDITVKETKDSTAPSGVKTHKACIGGFNGGNINDGARFENCAIIGDITVSVELSYFVYVGGFTAFTDNKNISILENCVYVPKDSGIDVTFMPAPTKEGEKLEQQAYVSMTIGKIGEQTQDMLSNVIAYRRALKITNEHEKMTETSAKISTDLSQFSEKIQDVISKL